MTEQSITQKKNEVLHRTALLATEERATKAEAVALEAVLKVNDALAKLPDMRFLVEQAYYLGIHHAQELFYTGRRTGENQNLTNGISSDYLWMR